MSDEVKDALLELRAEIEKLRITASQMANETQRYEKARWRSEADVYSWVMYMIDDRIKALERAKDEH